VGQFTVGDDTGEAQWRKPASESNGLGRGYLAILI
jgi:hypothetical protein